MESGVKGRGEKIFQVIAHIVLIIVSLCAILPFILLVVASFTDEQTLLQNGYSFFPKQWSVYAYTYLFKSNLSQILRSYGITILVTLIGTGINLFMTSLVGYVLSRKDYNHRKVMTFYVFLTMLFNGGLVPSYIMWTQIFHLKNSFFALLIPTLLMNGFQIMLVKSNMQTTIHPALIEAAKIDGAGEWYTFFKVIMPLTTPIMATVGLMAALGYWNDWTNGLYYISDSRLFSLQQLLNNILSNAKALQSMGSAATVTDTLPSTSIRMAMAVIGVIPILALYPFFQKYFVKGIALGAVKE
mgnify:CR=1 FL=1